ncbi:MAG: hypothetical protein JNK89_05625 [Saprospiraceae bacterium]|nr:hypothetical protein [Saprospiraceae bacterium]
MGYTNKVYQTLTTLDAATHRRLNKYILSPYFNQSKTLLRLYEIFRQTLETNPEGFDRQEVWAQLFPDTKYEDVNFRKCCSDLLKLVEDFMAQETAMNDPARRQIDLLEYVVRNKVEHLYNSALRQTRAILAPGSYRSLEFFKNSYRTERLYYEMMNFDVTLNTRANLEEISLHLDVFYWIEKLKLYSSVLSQRRTGNFVYELHFNEEILTFLQTFDMAQQPELAIYYNSFLTLFDEGNDQFYFRLRKLLDEFGAAMPKKEAIELYDSALHYCTGKLNKGNQLFLKEYFDLFEAGLEKGVFILNGELATWRFNNTTAVALRLGKLDWAESFIEKYKAHLPADTRENTYTFNLARLYRYQRKFDQVLALLRNLEYEDIGYNLLSKTMLLNAYYELEEHDALESFMESFRVFLNRQKNIPQARKKSYLNLIKYVRRLTRIAPSDKAALAKLKKELIQEKANHVNHEWLMEKIAELE